MVKVASPLYSNALAKQLIGIDEKRDKQYKKRKKALDEWWFNLGLLS